MKNLKNEEKILNIAYSLNERDYQDFIYLLNEMKVDNSLIKKVNEIFSNKKLNLHSISKTQKLSIINNLYKSEINKIVYIWQNKEILAKLNGLKILIHGKTGTGKTTLANEIILSLPKLFVYKITPEMLISYKMGQTQLNLLNIGHEINEKSKNSDILLFIDEVDSILSNRNNISDLGEFHRITASFIKFIDSLPKNTLLIFITNVLDKIDEAIIRRMNFQITGKEFEIPIFIDSLLVENKINITTQQKNFIINTFENSKFTINDYYRYLNDKLIDQNTDNFNKDYTYFCKYFKSKIPNLKIESERMKMDFKAEGY